MRFLRRCKELQELHEKAHRDIVHVEAALQEEVGSRLRAQQAIVLSVLAKCNGRLVPASPDGKFHAGCAAWAIALRDGFEVTGIRDNRVQVRAVCLPGSSQGPATYSLPLEMLGRSDRDVAKRIRSAVKRQKLEARAFRAWEAEREAKALAKEVKAAERKLVLLKTKHADLVEESQR